MESLLRELDLTKEERHRADVFDFAGLVQNLEHALDRARFVCPYPEFGGSVRNDMMKLIVTILNKCKGHYAFQKDYTITMEEEDAEKETGC